MQTETVDTVIIGAGLSGIYAAYLLSRQNQDFVVLEARDRVGGRILCPEHGGFHPDLGPSWYWPDINPRIARLIEVFGLHGYRQFESGAGRFQDPNGRVQTFRGYAMSPPCWRLSGGMIALVNQLCQTLPAEAIRLNHPVCEIERSADGAVISVGELDQAPLSRFAAKKVILALPPRLAAATLLFTPELSHELAQAMMRIGTWMAGQAKFCVLYETPFWREYGLSGEGFSQRGPLGEIHDGSNHDQSPYGLTGFVGVPAVQRTQPQHLTQAIVSQLATLYGEPAARPLAFYYQDWAYEPFTATEYDHPPMYEHPHYQAPAGKTAIWDGILHFAGTETDEAHGGYLEGALAAAERAAMRL